MLDTGWDGLGLAYDLPNLSFPPVPEMSGIVFQGSLGNMGDLHTCPQSLLQGDPGFTLGGALQWLIVLLSLKLL